MILIRNLFVSVMLFPVFSFANDELTLQFKNYPVEIYTGPFATTLNFDMEQRGYSRPWKEKLLIELKERINFAGHYRIYISKKGEFPNECGEEGWVCGWIIDKMTGRIVSSLPEFNGNAAYSSIINNGTPSPDPFFIEFYSNRTLIFIGGENTPKNKGYSLAPGDRKCAYSKYDFINSNFIKLSSIDCGVE